MRASFASLIAVPLLGCLVCLPPRSPAQADDEGALLNELQNIKTITSTVPANGDVNPYGVAIVPRTQGRLLKGHVLVSNFNNRNNQQGTGTTIADVAPNGSFSLFAQIDASKLPGSCPGGVGLTTALVVLKAGWVIVGSLPTTDGTAATAQAGCLIVLDTNGKPVETFSGQNINGPWDMTADDRGSEAVLLFTNVLNGTVAAGGGTVNGGTVVRLVLDLSGGQMPVSKGQTVIASGFPEHTDPNALVVGPTGLGLGFNPFFESGDTEPVLYVADTVSSAVKVVRHPLTRSDTEERAPTLSSNNSLNGPLGLAVAPNGHVLTVNGGDGFITEIAPNGVQVANKLLDNTGGPPPGAGALFGLATTETKVFFVDDGSNTLNVLQ